VFAAEYIRIIISVILMIYNLGLNRGTVNSKKVLNRPVQEYKMIVKIQEGTMI
jgi:hypothetical protein